MPIFGLARMIFNTSGLRIIQGFESCRLTAYRDLKGILTIGWGSTDGVREGMRITQEDADERMNVAIGNTARVVKNLVPPWLNDNQYSALISFSYNEGTGRLQTSQLLAKLKAWDVLGAENEFPKWCIEGGTKCNGLLRRRLAEQALFRSDVELMEKYVRD